MDYWTQEQLQAAYTHELIEWNNKIVPKIQRGKELGVNMKNSKKILKLIVAELKRRGEII